MPASITREQVRAAITALGLDPDDTQTLQITPQTVYTSTVHRDPDGSIPVQNGLVPYAEDTIHITEPGEEVPDDGADS